MAVYKKLMTDKEFYERLVNIVDKVNTVYLYGGTGQLITNEIISAKAKQLPKWYTPTRISKLKSYVGKNYYGFDCVNVGKSIFWGFGTEGGVKYATNTVPDTSANGMINICEDISTDMKNIQFMECIWFDGHVGYYIGEKDGIDYCIECAPSINKVGITKMSYQGKWKKHGKFPWLEYAEECNTAKFDNKAWSKKLQVACNIYNFKIKTMKKLKIDGVISDKSLDALPEISKGKKNEFVKLAQEKLISLGYNLGKFGSDGDFGNETFESVVKFQNDKGLHQTGVIDTETWKALCK